MEDAFSEILEVTDTEGDSLQHLDFVVAAFGEAIRPGGIQGVQDLLEPVVTRLRTSFKLRQLHGFHRPEPLDQLLLAYAGGTGVHDLQKRILHTVGIRQPGGDLKHQCQPRPILVSQFLRGLIQKPSGTLEILAEVVGQLLLLVDSDPFHAPHGLSGDMIAVCNDSSFREAYLCDFPEMGIHVRNKILNIFSVMMLLEILDQVGFVTIRQNIENLPFLWISQDGLIFLTSCVTLELVDGQHLRQFMTAVAHRGEIAHSGGGGDVELGSDLLNGDDLAELVDHGCHEPAGHTVIPGDEGILFSKPLAAVVAAIATLTQVQKGVSGHGDILDDLGAIVVYTVSDSPTDRADMVLPGQCDIDMKLPGKFFNIRDNYIFQIEELCSIIFHEHRGLLFWFVGVHSL